MIDPIDLLTNKMKKVTRAKTVYWTSAWTHHEKLKHPEEKKLSIMRMFLHHTESHRLISS